MAPAEDNVSKALDAALEMTFPASDPIAVYIPDPMPRPSEPRRLGNTAAASSRKQGSR